LLVIDRHDQPVQPLREGRCRGDLLHDHTLSSPVT
jgi:hypothetical protein